MAESEVVRRAALMQVAAVRVSLQHHPLTALAALVWNGGLPRPLQQMLFDTADSLAPQRPPSRRDGPPDH